MASALPEGTMVEVNSMDNCPYCADAKAWLLERGIPFTEIVRNDREERRAFYRDVCDLNPLSATSPQIFLIDGSSGERYRIGGYNDLRASGLG